MKKLVVMLMLAVVAFAPMAVAEGPAPEMPPEEANNQPYTPDTGDGITTVHHDDAWGGWVTVYYVAFVMVYLWLYATGWVRITI